MSNDERAKEFVECLGNGQPEYAYDIDEEEEDEELLGFGLLGCFC